MRYTLSNELICSLHHPRPGPQRQLIPRLNHPRHPAHIGDGGQANLSQNNRAVRQVAAGFDDHAGHAGKGGNLARVH